MNSLHVNNTCERSFSFPLINSLDFNTLDARANNDNMSRVSKRLSKLSRFIHRSHVWIYADLLVDFSLVLITLCGDSGSVQQGMAIAELSGYSV